MLFSLDLRIESAPSNALICNSQQSFVDVATEYSILTANTANTTLSTLHPADFYKSLQIQADINPLVQGDAMFALQSLISNPYLFQEGKFTLTIEQEVTCNVCQTKSSRPQSNNHLLLRVPFHADTIQNMIDTYSEIDNLTGPNQYQCDICNASYY